MPSLILPPRIRPIAHVRTGVTIRPARESDAASFYTSCYTDRDWARFARQFRAGLQRQKMRSLLYLVAESGADIVAGCKLISYTDRLEIADLIVAPAWRNRGLGTTLIQTMLDIGYTLGASQIEIGVLQHNDRARSLYERLGFRFDRELQLLEKEPAIILAHRPQPEHGPSEPSPLLTIP